jgi:peptidoglycan-associated lipoprotein
MTIAFTAPARRALRLGSAACLLVWLAACSSPVRLDPLPPVENRGPLTAPPASAAGSGSQALPTAQSRVTTVDLGRQGGAGAGSAANASGLAGQGGAGGKPLGGAGGAGGGAGAALVSGDGRVIYFDFDSFAVREDYQPIIATQARRLASDRGRKLLLEGHTDERGGREYNLALGQRRAESVSRALALMGAQDGQIEAVSYGKERPAATGNDESVWARNRRVELKDR